MDASLRNNQRSYLTVSSCHRISRGRVLMAGVPIPHSKKLQQLVGNVYVINDNAEHCVAAIQDLNQTHEVN